MKIGFSSLACPGWDLDTILGRAAEYGFDGVELRGLRGELHLPLVPELAANPDSVRTRFAEHRVELVALGCSATLDGKKASVRAANKQQIAEFIELAGRLGCPFVRILAGEVQRWDNARSALGRITEGLISLMPLAARTNVTLLVENGGDFPSSTDLWFMADAVNHPAVRCCWNQCTAMLVLERATNSIPRLGNRIGMVHVCDGKFDEQGLIQEYVPLGSGDVGVARQIELLRGLVFSGYLMFEWPKLWIESLAPPESILPATAKYLRERLADKQPILSAYKGDKNAPKFASFTVGVES